MIISKSKRAGT